MAAWRLRFNELMLAAALALGTALIGYAALRKLGTAGLLAPLGLVLIVALLRRPLLLSCLVVGLAGALRGA